MHDPREGVFLRIYNPIVKYFENPFLEEDAIYIPEEDVIFTVVNQCPSNWGEHGWPEIFWVYPEEVRLLASVALSVPEGLGTLGFAPKGEQLRLNITSEKITNWEVIQSVKKQAIQIARKTYGENLRYKLRGAKTSGEEFQQRLFQGIDTGDALLIRGLSCLLKSQHLMGVECQSFCEEAFMNVQIAREGALQIIRRRLQNSKGKSASYENAHEYIQKNFEFGDAFVAYLKKQHDQWVKAKHPESKWGIFWAPPLEAEDFFETYEALVTIYRHLITGEPGRETASL